MPKPKIEPEEKYQRPGPKKPMRLQVPDRRLPHDDLIKPLAIAPTAVATTAAVEDKPSPSPPDSPPPDDSLSKHASIGYQIDRQPAEGSPSRGDRPANLWASVPVVKGHTKLYHMITDHLYRHLDPYEQAVYTQLYRLSWGYGKDTCNISNPKLAERANLKLTVLRRAVADLERKGLVEKVAYRFGKNKEQGIDYRLPLPDSLSRPGRLSSSDSLSPDGPIKETVFSKDPHTKAPASPSPVGVGVGSRFSLEQCRAYADHLHKTGQGIKQPGAYATTIFRSGEADTLIEAFLFPPAQIDISQCPDCEGRAFVYVDPQNHDKGVRPCKHEKLRA